MGTALLNVFCHQIKAKMQRNPVMQKEKQSSPNVEKATVQSIFNVNKQATSNVENRLPFYFPC